MASIKERLPLGRKLSEQVVEMISNFGKKPYLLNAGEEFTATNRKTAVMLLGIDSWLRETFERGTRVWTLAKYGINSFAEFAIKGLRLGVHAYEGIVFSGEMALADRIGNEVRVLAVTDKEKGKAFRLYEEARENPLLNHHGWPHERRIERLAEMIIWGVDWLRHGPENIKNWILLPYLFSWSHDMDQSSTLQRNLTEKTKLKAKLMHNAAGAAKVKLLQPFLEKAAEIDKDTSERLTAGLMVINLLHDEPELIQKRLGSSGLAAEFRRDPQLLFERWQAGEINPYSLSFADVMTIMRIGKRSGGFVTKATPNGLDPDAEAVYRKRLKILSGDQNRTLGEMINFKDENDRKAFHHVLDICVIADLMDMYIPAGESMLKKFLVQASKERPLFRDIRPARFIRAVTGKGNVDSQVDFDLRRMIWEIVNTFAIAKQSAVGRDPFVLEIITAAAVESLAVLYEDFPLLMTGSLAPVQRIYFEREVLLAEKALRRQSRSKIYAKSHAESIYRNRSYPVEARTALTERLADSRDFIMACERLDVEAVAVLQALELKPDNSVYSEQDREKAKKLISLAAQELGLEKLLAVVLHDLERQRRAPYLSYDVLGKSRPKVIHAGIVK